MKKLPIKLVKEILLAGELLDQYVGRYRLAPGMVLTISAADGRLSAHATGQGAAAIYAGKHDEFEFRAVEARLQFQRDANGKLTSVVLHQGGQHFTGLKARYSARQAGPRPSRMKRWMWPSMTSSE